MKKSLNGLALMAFFLALIIVAVLTAGGCGSSALKTDNGEKLTVDVEAARIIEAEAKKRTVNANLRTINGAIMIYFAENEIWPADRRDLVASGILSGWPNEPDGVTYDLATAAGEVVAAAFRNNAGSWWSAEDDVVTMPVDW